jgi:predicted O-linked N-acetylglucosamine transferase (SPINDLY family)
LEAARLPQLVCRSSEDFVELAVRLACRPGELETIKEHLCTQRLCLPLFDTGRFVRHLENAIESAWRRYVEGNSPEHFAVPEMPC